MNKSFALVFCVLFFVIGASFAQDCPSGISCSSYSGPFCCEAGQQCHTGYHSGICCWTHNESICAAPGGATIGGPQCYSLATEECCAPSTGSTNIAVCLKGKCCGANTASPSCCDDGETCVNGVCTADNTQPQPDTGCASGLERCGQHCYHAGTFECFDGILCERGFQRCGEQCYNPNTFECYQEVPVLKCEERFQRCGDHCYNPNTFVCFEDGILCEKGFQRCGDHCYNPNTFDCFEDGILCEKGFQRCGEQCYNPNTFECFQEVPVMKCEERFQRCGDHCYNPNTFTCFENRLLCERGFERCGEQCYNPSVYRCCPNGLTSPNGVSC